jgi:integrase
LTKALTAQSVGKLKPDPTRRRELADGLLPGLYLVLQPSGARSWAVRYRHAGRPRKLTLGTYPVLDLASARARAREVLQAVSLGRDPCDEKRAQQRIAREEGSDRETVPSIVSLFLERHTRKNNKARSAEEVERIFRRYVVPAWEGRRIQEITRRDVVHLLDSIVDRGFPIAANRTLSHVRKLFNWCIDRSILDASPCVRIGAPAKERSRDRVLADNELQLLWHASDRVGVPFGSLLKMLILTGQRRDEVAGMRWSEIKENGQLWTIPGERTKNGTEHDVPLSQLACDVLAGLPRQRADFLFTTTGKTPVSGYSAAKLRIDREIGRLAQETTGCCLEHGAHAPQHWRVHDLRRTVASGMARLGVAVNVIEAVLNHRGGQVSGVSAIYNRHSYMGEKRRALELWASHVDVLVHGVGSNVIQLRRAE